MMGQKVGQVLLVLCLNEVFVVPAGYDDGSAPTDHRSAAQGGQHQ